MGIANRCQLITYPDSFGTSLSDLGTVLDTYLRGIIGGVHILPFYPSSADRGFAPLTYFEVDPAFGSWEDIKKLSGEYDLTVDFMMNHISRRSEYFLDFLQKKDASPYADLFIRYKDFWPPGRPGAEDLRAVYTRKPRPPYLEAEFADGTTEKVWCTFDYEQIDLNFSSGTTRKLVKEFLVHLCKRGIKMVRLDAFAYSTKKVGTNCFFVEPEVWEYLEFVRDIVAPYGVDILPEVHEHYSIQLRCAEKGYWVYDFSLPMLVLQALYDGNGTNLKHWLGICPRNQFTTLDTHDGIGVVDAVDLLSPEELERTKENLYSRGANVKKVYNTERYNNLDVYQLNCTYYSALGNDDEAYLLARAIQFFTPGIPQVYYVGLLAGKNDIELLEKTKIGRNINRRHYTLEEAARETSKPVVRELFTLMELRNRSAAFDGAFMLHETEPHELHITWEKGGEIAELKADLRSKEYTVKEYVNGCE